MKRKLIVAVPFMVSVLLACGSCGNNSTSRIDSTPSSTPQSSTPISSTTSSSTPTPTLPTPVFIDGDYGNILGEWKASDVDSIAQVLNIEAKAASFETEGLSLDLYPTKVAIENYSYTSASGTSISYDARTVYYSVLTSQYTHLQFKVYLPEIAKSLLYVDISNNGSEYSEYATLYPDVIDFNGVWSQYPDEEWSMNFVVDNSKFDNYVGAYSSQLQYSASSANNYTYVLPFYSYSKGSFSKQIEVYMGFDETDIELMYTLRLVENADYGYVLTDDLTGEAEYASIFYPSTMTMSSDLWFDGEKDRTIEISGSENAYKISIDGKEEVDGSFKYDESIGSYLEFTMDGKTSTIRKVFGGIYIDDRYLAIKDPSAYVGRYSLGGIEFKLAEGYDDDFNLIYTLTFNNEEIPAYEYALSEDNVLGLRFSLDNTTYTVYTNDGLSLLINDGSFVDIYPSVDYFEQSFVGDFYVYDLDASNKPIRSEFIINDDHSGTYKGEAIAFADFIYYDGGYCIYFSTSDSVTHYFYYVDDGILVHYEDPSLEEYSIFASQDIIDDLSETWTDGKKDYFTFDGENITIIDATVTSFMIDYDTGESTLIAIVILSDGTVKAIYLGDTAIIYDLDPDTFDLSNGVSLVKKGDFEKIVGQYTYITPNGEESVYVDADGKFSITTLVDGANKDVEYDYEVYYFGEEICIAFAYTDTMNLMVYFNEEGVVASMFGGNIEFYLGNIMGLYKDANSDDSIYIADDLEVFINGSGVGFITSKKVVDGNDVLIIDENQSITITEAGIIYSFGDIEQFCTRVSFEFDVYVQAKEEYKSADEETTVQFGRDLNSMESINNGFYINGSEYVYDDYTIEIIDGSIVITISYGMDNVILTITGDDVTVTYEAGSIPLPPPPPPLPMV